MKVKGKYMGLDVLGYYVKTPTDTYDLNSDSEYYNKIQELMAKGYDVVSSYYWCADSCYHAELVER